MAWQRALLSASIAPLVVQGLEDDAIGNDAGSGFTNRCASVDLQAIQLEVMECFDESAYEPLPPGEGWEDRGRRQITKQDFQTLKPYVMTCQEEWPIADWSPSSIMREHLPGILKNKECEQKFDRYWVASMLPSFQEIGDLAVQQAEEMLSTGLSGGLPVYTSVGVAEKVMDFGTHIHGSLEYMWIVAGNEGETRLSLVDGDGYFNDYIYNFTQEDMDKGMGANMYLPKIGVEAQFEVYNITPYNKPILVNPLGSAHRSNCDIGLAILTMYGLMESHIGIGPDNGENDQVPLPVNGTDPPLMLEAVMGFAMENEFPAPTAKLLRSILV